jgi:hypothetical protein
MPHEVVTLTTALETTLAAPLNPGLYYTACGVRIVSTPALYIIGRERTCVSKRQYHIAREETKNSVVRSSTEMTCRRKCGIEHPVIDSQAITMALDHARTPGKQLFRESFYTSWKRRIFGLNTDEEMESRNTTTPNFVEAPKVASDWLPSISAKGLAALIRELPKMAAVLPLVLFIFKYGKKRVKHLGRADRRWTIVRWLVDYRDKLVFHRALNLAANRKQRPHSSLEFLPTFIKNLGMGLLGVWSPASIYGDTSQLMTGNLNGLNKMVLGVISVLAGAEEVAKAVMTSLGLWAFSHSVEPSSMKLIQHSLFGLVELLIKWRGDNEYTLPALIPAACVHISTGFLPWYIGWPLHVAFNTSMMHLKCREVNDAIAPWDEIDVGPVDRSKPMQAYESEEPWRPLGQGSQITVKVLGKTYRGDQIEKLRKQLHSQPRFLEHPWGVCFNVRPQVQAPSDNNLITGLRNRVLFQTQDPAVGAWKRVFKSTYHCRERIYRHIKPIDFATWNGKYDGAKQGDNLRSLIKVLRKGKDPKPTIQPFLKLEHNHSFILKPKAKDPRIISPTMDKGYKVLTGPMISTIYKRMCEVWDGGNLASETHKGSQVKTITIMSKPDGNKAPIQVWADQVNQRLDDLRHIHSSMRGWGVWVSGDDNFVVLKLPGRPVVRLYCDGVRWDVTYCEDAIKGENTFFKHAARMAGTAPFTMGALPESMLSKLDDTERGFIEDVGQYTHIEQFGRLLDEELIPSIHFRAFLKISEDATVEAECKPMRTSGSTRTSPGNNYGNGSACASFCETVTWESTDIAELETKWRKHWVGLGINPECGVSLEMDGSEFCSHLLCPQGGVYYAVPKIGRFFLRNGWSVGTKRSRKEAVALTKEYRAYLNFPFLRIVLRRTMLLLNIPEHDIQTPEGWYPTPKFLEHKVYQGEKAKFPEPDEETWTWFYNRYGVTQDDEHRLARAMCSVLALPWKVDYDISPFLDVDL